MKCRRTPIQRRTRLKRRTGLRRVSRSREPELRKYARLSKSWLLDKAFCECPTSFGTCVRRPDHVHHIRGRAGKLLNDTRYWLAVCHLCHHWIHFVDPKEARRLNILQF